MTFLSEGVEWKYQVFVDTAKVTAKSYYREKKCHAGTRRNMVTDTNFFYRSKPQKHKTLYQNSLLFVIMKYRFALCIVSSVFNFQILSPKNPGGSVAMIAN